MLAVSSLIYEWPGGPPLRYELSVSPGDILLVHGPSGAGKSTLLSLIAGFIEPSGGDIRWNNATLLPLPPDQRPVTCLFQSGNLFTHLDAFTNIALGLHPGAKLNAAQTKRVHDTLEALGLAELANRLPDTLSGGQQQRVALARALVRARPILLLDEPFTALDPDTRDEMLVLVRDLVNANNLATLVVSHDREDSIRLAAAELGVGHADKAKPSTPTL